MKRTSRRRPDKIEQDRGRPRRRKNTPKMTFPRFTQNPMNRSTRSKRRPIQMTLDHLTQQVLPPRIPPQDMTRITQRSIPSRTNNSRPLKVPYFCPVYARVLKTNSDSDLPAQEDPTDPYSDSNYSAARNAGSGSGSGPGSRRHRERRASLGMFCSLITPP